MIDRSVLSFRFVMSLPLILSSIATAWRIPLLRLWNAWRSYQQVPAPRSTSRCQPLRACGLICSRQGARSEPSGVKPAIMGTFPSVWSPTTAINITSWRSYLNTPTCWRDAVPHRSSLLWREVVCLTTTLPPTCVDARRTTWSTPMVVATVLTSDPRERYAQRTVPQIALVVIPVPTFSAYDTVKQFWWKLLTHPYLYHHTHITKSPSLRHIGQENSFIRNRHDHP